MKIQEFHPGPNKFDSEICKYSTILIQSLQEKIVRLGFLGFLGFDNDGKKKQGE